MMNRVKSNKFWGKRFSFPVFSDFMAEFEKRFSGFNLKLTMTANIASFLYYLYVCVRSVYTHELKKLGNEK